MRAWRHRKNIFTNHDLVINQTTHSGIKPLFCYQCDKDFSTTGKLKSHKLSHMQEKKFACDKTFSGSGKLKIQKLCHTRLEDFVCNQCEKAFFTSGHLKDTSSPTQRRKSLSAPSVTRHSLN